MLLAALGLGACKGGPTEPDASEQGSVRIDATLSNVAGTATIQNARMLVDGVDTDDEDSTTTGAAAQITFFAWPDLFDGQHTVSFLVASQTTTTPTTYRLHGARLFLTACPGGTFADSGSSVETIDLKDQTADLVAGQSITYSFYMPACEMDDMSAPQPAVSR